MYYAVNQAYKTEIEGLSDISPTASQFFCYLLTNMNDNNILVDTLENIAFNLFGVKTRRKIRECVKYLEQSITTLANKDLILVEETYDDNLIFQVSKDVAVYIGYPFTMLKLESEHVIVSDEQAAEDTEYHEEIYEEVTNTDESFDDTNTKAFASEFFDE